MPRKNRIEYAGALYHVINRGNYRKPIFAERGAGRSFEKTMFEVVERCGWRLYAYTLMSNHYHLCIETPEPNLVEGMQYLQSVFATRFNRYRNERGHVFQARYKSIVVGDQSRLLGLLDYIHLNPVRAQICDLSGLRSYELSSYSKYWKREIKTGLSRSKLLEQLGLKDEFKGMKTYEAHLKSKIEGEKIERKQLQEKYCGGWFIGEEIEKEYFLKWLIEKQPEVTLEGSGFEAVKKQRQEAIVLSELKRLNKNEDQIQRELKGAKWKIEIARRLRSKTTAKNNWIARRLNMGHPSNVSKFLGDRL